MNFELVKASYSDKEVIKNLMQFYVYDFSEYIEYDVNKNGLFAEYPGLEDYWKDGNRFPYIIKSNEKYAGFVLVRYIRSEQRNYFSIAEFFILKKYRRQGMGNAVAEQVFNLHKGQWEVYQKETNKPAQEFWHKVIANYTKGQFKERIERGRRIQDFEN